MAAEAATKYTDPVYASLDDKVSQKLGLPDGLLSSIRTKGERSNSDQVSEDGAKSVYQIIPATRKAVLDKYGIDAYLSKENAAEAAGLLLKESLDRNNGDQALAAAEYHGGTDRANWGPRTRAYVGRVTGEASAAPAAPVQPGQSTFDKVFAQMSKPDESEMAGVLKAYQSGQMSPDDAKAFESEVNAGRVMLPQGVNLKGDQPAPAASAEELPAQLIQAYNSGQMTPGDRQQLDQAIKSGAVTVPQGVTLKAPPERGLVGKAIEAVTGADRATPQTQGLPDWATMPELNSFSMASAKTGLGTLLSNPQETVKVIQANFPGVQVRQDEKGNYLLRSSMDGQEYAIKPGFAVSDIPRAAAGVAAFTPAGRATSVAGAGLAAAGTQAAIEASQAATGGEFNPGEVLMAGVGGAAVPAVVNAVRAVAQPARQALARVRGAPEPAAAASPGAVPPPGVAAAAEPVPVVPPQAGSVAPTVPAVPSAAPGAAAPAMSAAELAQTARSAAEGGLGSGRATRVLAEQASPDARTVEAAKRLGIDEYLQPDHVTTSQAYRELAQAVKSVPGSTTRSAELQGLERVAKRADDLVNEVGGTTDVSMLDATVKSRLQATQQDLEKTANKLYAELRDNVPAKTGAPARNVLDFVEQRAKDLGGRENLTPMEKQIVGKLAPKSITDDAGKVVGKKQPTYALLDDVRKDLGAAARASGPFKDADTGLAKKLYSLLSDDQAAVVGRLGMKDTYNAARQAVAVRKGLEDDMTSLFGKQLDGSLVGDLSGAVNALPKGDASKLIKLLKVIPEDMRQNVVASGLNTAFGKSARNGSLNFNTYANWYEGLLRNKQSYAAVMSNLPPAARKQLSDLYRVARGVSSATRERITTGRIQAVQQELQGGESLLGNIYSLAKRAGVGAAAEAVTTPLGMPGAGISASLASALTKGKPNALKAADALISSPEFIQAAKQAGKPGQAAAARGLAFSKPFTRFVRAVGQPRELSNRERWILQALQAQNQQREK